MKTPIHIIDAKQVGKYTIWIKFQDGTAGEVDLENQLFGEVFEPLRNDSLFKQFTVDPELKTITWPNGADFAPEYLYSAVTGGDSSEL